MTNFVKVYALTFCGKRVCFIYGRTSKRLPAVCPISLFGQIIYDPISRESQFICFDHRYAPELYEVSRVLSNDVYDDTYYRRLCNISHKDFLDYVHSFHLVQPDSLVTKYENEVEDLKLFG